MEETLRKLEDLVDKELSKIVAKGDLTPAELELATKAVCLIEKIKMVGDEGMYSESSYARDSYGRRMSYDMPYHYRDDYGHNGRDYYIRSMDRGYSSHSVKDRMIAQLESTMMDSAQSDSEKRVIESLISKLSSEAY